VRRNRKIERLFAGGKHQSALGDGTAESVPVIGDFLGSKKLRGDENGDGECASKRWRLHVTAPASLAA